ncbi:40S ribosomal protein S12 [Schizosaccharomyces pombe]|uniref:Small ribosomal subunit protein eS12B n=1 Tax=Schizosaccharomyces pombe (strain 972 / ATCC 24843) TaxID=284812 RepID=RS12B_SCHPO|nr:40S ribosomal protein S12 [Schizosaccharomyces pombe]O74322.1 RecName: Full=Small ribosomal subunit protein eS12B; AltName: Full=40S ribosomal protein S12-B [Schizosaccharomyces pombe 972h-]CAA20050.1 40S ribosomal protein S12 (predicted) [Schizosaccharomyces pombe]|eukprot:NP_595206.1 40S ribosomal protein S12 [Schizosaccharomyces pombe]
MSTEGDHVPQAEEVIETVEVVEEETGSSPLSVEDSLKEVLKRALVHDGLARGIREASKALDRRQAHLCVLCESCDQEAYVKLVEALCAESQTPLVKVADPKILGEWAGLCVLDRDGNARKVVGCSCVAVTDYGEDSVALQTLLSSFAA